MTRKKHKVEEQKKYTFTELMFIEIKRTLVIPQMKKKKLKGTWKKSNSIKFYRTEKSIIYQMFFSHASYIFSLHEKRIFLSGLVGHVGVLWDVQIKFFFRNFI